MGTSPLFNPHRRIRCPSCGSEQLDLRVDPDRPDRVTQTPSDSARRLFIADMQLYDCRKCRLRFYDIGPTAAPSLERTPDAAREDIEIADPAASTVIGQTVTVRGRLSSQEDILVNGEIHGDLEIPGHRLTVGIAGRVYADVLAAEVVALGTVEGNADARRTFVVRASATVTGSIRTPSLAVEEGAFVQGQIETA